MPFKRVARPLECGLGCAMALACGIAAAQDDSSSSTSSSTSSSSTDPMAIFGPPSASSQPGAAQGSSGSSQDTQSGGEQPQPEQTPEGQAADAPAPDSQPVATVPVTPAPAPAPAATQLEDITVTAQRRAESLQATPVSVSAFNAQKLEARGISNILDLGSHVPGMQIEPFPINIATLRIFIRGIGALDAQVTQDPAIGVYLDGVYLGRSAGLAFDVADLERIEVLRGPQGTLYGRNTVGGAINLITRKPSTAGFEMEHKFMTGDRNYAAGRSMVNIPISDNLASKFVVMSSHKDGFIKNSGPGQDFGNREDTALRADVRYEPLDWLTADYGFDYTDINYVQYLYQAILTPETNHGQAETFKRYGQSQTVYSPDRLSSMSSGASMEPSHVRIRGHALNLTGTFDGLQVKYTGAHRELFDKSYADLSGGLDVSGGQGNPEYRLDSGPYDGPATIDPNTNDPTSPNNVGGPIPTSWLRNFQKQTSHELQVLGDLWDDEIRYIAGVFRYEETGFDDRCGTAGWDCTHKQTHQFNTRLDPNVPERLTNLVLVYRTDIENTSTAYFGQFTWTPAFDFIEKKLHLTVGYRHTVDDRRAVKNYNSRIYQEDLLTNTANDITDQASTCQDPALTQGTPGSDVFNDVHVARSFSNNSWSGILAYDLTPDVNTYAKYVQAYKSGGFDTRDPQVTGETQSADCTTYHIGFVTGFGPEYVDSTEAGIKSEWLNRSLRVNLNLFDMDYHDRQISALIQGAIQDTKTRNIGRSNIKGAELETSWLPMAGLVTSVEYEYLQAKTLEVFDFNGNNVKDNYQPYSAPHNSYSASIDWTPYQFGWGALHTYLNFNHVDKRKGQTLPNRVGLTYLDAYSLLGARVGLEGIPFWGRGRFDVALWGRNILDESYAQTALDNLPQADRAVIWGEPRSIGADLIYHWN